MLVYSRSIERSRITKRNKTYSYPNTHFKTFTSESKRIGENGVIELKISNRTLRTIEKHGGFDQYLLKTKKINLTEEGKILKRAITKTVNPTYTVKKSPHNNISARKLKKIAIAANK